MTESEKTYWASEVSDVELNAIADAGSALLREQGLERLLQDVLKFPSVNPYDSNSDSYDPNWKGGNTEWTNPPTE